MFSNARERFLAFLFGGAVAVAGIWETAGRVILRPLNEAATAVDAARAANGSLQEQCEVIEHSLRNLRQLSGQSLPADPGKASVLYQGWLIRRLQECSISSAIVTPSPTISENSLGHRIPFTVQCEASSHGIARFLDQFYATPLLHRITNLNIASSSEGQSDHRVTMSIEAISLSTAEKVESLPEPAVAENEHSLQACMAAGDIFRRQLPVQRYVETKQTVDEPDSEPEPPREVKPAPRVNPLRSVRFVASVWNGQQREAWLVDGRSKEEIAVAASTDLRLPEISGHVVAVGEDVLDVEFDGQPRRIRLGQTLDSADSGDDNL